MRVSATMSARDIPRPSRAVARVLPKLGSLSEPAFDGSADGVERVGLPLSLLTIAGDRASTPGSACLGAASVPLRDLAPESCLFPDMVSLPELTVSSVFCAVAIHPAPPRRRTKTRELPSTTRNLQLA